jgi:Zn-dependent peptidase ImmA (M78 family)
VSAVTVHDGAERDAQDLLERLGVTDIPVDPITIARALGLKVWTSRLEPNVAGVLDKRSGQPPEIYVNASDHINRQRFTVAHEVGHFIERAVQGKADETGSFVDYRDDLATQGTNPAERYANGFAAALLMPARHVRDLWESCQDPEILAQKFQVSAAAMRNRLDNLGLR